MIRKTRSFVLLIFAICLTGCVPAIATTPANAGNASPILVSPTFIITPTETPTPLATLTPLEANERIRAYLQKTLNCSAPCFLGITPEQTTLNEATNLFTSLGLQPEHTLTESNQEFYDTNYIENDLDIELSILLTVQNSEIKTLDVGMTDTSEVGTPRMWTAYSPETLIRRYGSPSRVDFSLGRVENPSHTMVLYFESVHMIILYIGNATYFLKDSNFLELCPLTNKVDFINLWMGNEPRYPPSAGVPLEEATSLTIDEFSKLMLGDPNQACFNLKDEAFP